MWPFSGKPKSEVGPLVKLAAPVALAQLANFTMQIVDTMFVGRLGPEVIGGISIGNAFYIVFMILGTGLLLGLDFMVSYAYGAGRKEDCHEALVQGVYVATGVSIPFIAAMQLITYSFDHLGIPGAVASEASLYLRMLSYSLWPLLLFSAFRQYLQAMGVAMPVMLILFLANVVNIICNWIFVYGHLGAPAMGIQGSGLSTVFARIFMFIAIAAFVIYRDGRLKLGLRKVRLAFSRKKAFQLVHLGLPAGTQLLLETGVFATATLLVGRLGASALAAHQITLQVASMSFMVPLGLSAATAVRVGQAMGKSQGASAVRIGWTAIVLGALFMAASGISLYLLAVPIIHIFTSNADVTRIGVTLLLLAAFFQLFDGIQVVATGALRGVANTHASMLANLFGHWFFGLPVGYFLCFHMHYGVNGLWIGLSLGLIIVSLILLLVWQRKSRLVLRGKLAA